MFDQSPPSYRSRKCACDHALPLFNAMDYHREAAAAAALILPKKCCESAFSHGDFHGTRPHTAATHFHSVRDDCDYADQLLPHQRPLLGGAEHLDHCHHCQQHQGRKISGGGGMSDAVNILPLTRTLGLGSGKNGLGKVRGSETDVENFIVVAGCGVVSLQIGKVRVDISTEGALRLQNFESGVMLAVNKSCTKSAFLHPIGSLYQHGDKINLTAHSENGNYKLACIAPSGIFYKAMSGILPYVTDDTGSTTKANVKQFLMDTNSSEIVESVFRDGIDPKPSAEVLSKAEHMASTLKYDMDDADDSEIAETWQVGSIRIRKIKLSGLKKVTIPTIGGSKISQLKKENKVLLSVVRTVGDEAVFDVGTTLAASGNIGGIGDKEGGFRLRKWKCKGWLKSQLGGYYCTASLGDKRHIFVRKEKQRLHFDGVKFEVRHGTQHAGFENDEFRLFTKNTSNFRSKSNSPPQKKNGRGNNVSPAAAVAAGK